MEPRQVRKRAVALKYASGDSAPKVVATGAGTLAERILALAKEANIPVREDSSLTDILGQLSLGAEIPEATYLAVAEILAFLFKSDEELVKRSGVPKAMPVPSSSS